MDPAAELQRARVDGAYSGRGWCIPFRFGMLPDSMAIANRLGVRHWDGPIAMLR